MSDVKTTRVERTIEVRTKITLVVVDKYSSVGDGLTHVQRWIERSDGYAIGDDFSRQTDVLAPVDKTRKSAARHARRERR
jgi:hypothetical protein